MCRQAKATEREELSTDRTVRQRQRLSGKFGSFCLQVMTWSPLVFRLVKSKDISPVVVLKCGVWETPYFSSRWETVQGQRAGKVRSRVRARWLGPSTSWGSYCQHQYRGWSQRQRRSWGSLSNRLIPTSSRVFGGLAGKALEIVRSLWLWHLRSPMKPLRIISGDYQEFSACLKAAYITKPWRHTK